MDIVVKPARRTVLLFIITFYIFKSDWRRMLTKGHGRCGGTHQTPVGSWLTLPAAVPGKARFRLFVGALPDAAVQIL